MTASEHTYQNFFFSGEIPCQKKATGEKKCVSALQFFSQPEGYVTYENQQFNYVYQYRDQLGNARLSYTDTDESGDISQDEIIQENHYMPFGLKHKGYNNVVSSNGNSVAQKFKYNGKGLEESLGYAMYEYEARHYDAALGRFVTIDPLAEDYSYQSTYVYAINNPIRFIDKLGMGPEWIDNGGGTYTAEDGDSASTLHTQFLADQGYTFEEVDAMVQEQYGPNRTEGGIEKSNVHPTNIVRAGRKVTTDLGTFYVTRNSGKDNNATPTTDESTRVVTLTKESRIYLTMISALVRLYDARPGGTKSKLRTSNMKNPKKSTLSSKVKKNSDARAKADAKKKAEAKARKEKVKKRKKKSDRSRKKRSIGIIRDYIVFLSFR
ncbi:MAG: hypothetical protein GKR88_02995 [Flavobacteriaceae bacterium]|nr:MAG: hypothetical protein GKR88_02995 [Flavobacteriaceae bacterium]